MALGGRNALLAIVVWNKEGRSGGRPHEERRKRTPRARRSRRASGKWGAPGSPGVQAGPPSPARARSPRSPVTFRPPLPYSHLFPRKAGIRGCPGEPRRGRHFPGKARRASAPGAPEREPEGSARPRALLRAGRAPGSGVLAPGAAAPSLRPAPPRSFHCQPGSRRPARRPPRPPRRSPRRPGASLLRPLRPELRIPGSRRSPRASLARGAPPAPHPSSAAPLARPPGPAPAAGVPPPPRRPLLRREASWEPGLSTFPSRGEPASPGAPAGPDGGERRGAPSGPCPAPAAGFVSRPRGPANNDAAAMAGSPGAAPPAPRAAASARRSPRAGRARAAPVRAGLLAFLRVLPVRVNGGRRQFSGRGCGGAEGAGEGMAPSHIPTSRRSRSAASPASPGCRRVQGSPGARGAIVLGSLDGGSARRPRTCWGRTGPLAGTRSRDGARLAAHRLQGPPLEAEGVGKA